VSNQHCHPDPNQDSGKEQKRKVSGELHVRGEIVMDTPPEIKNADAADKKQTASRESLKVWIEGLTLLILLIYAGLTGIQSCQAIKSTNAAKKAADVAEKHFT
jgi:hypothetical protein